MAPGMGGIAFVWLNSSESQQEAAGEGRRWGHRSLERVDPSQQPLCTCVCVWGVSCQAPVCERLCQRAGTSTSCVTPNRTVQNFQYLLGELWESRCVKPQWLNSRREETVTFVEHLLGLCKELYVQLSGLILPVVRRPGCFYFTDEGR